MKNGKMMVGVVSLA